VKLAKEDSEDATGAGAEFIVKPDSAQPPPQMKSVLLQSKAGTVTDPLRHDNGYYVFRVESMDVLPYETVKDEIYNKIQDQHFREWQVRTQQQVSVQIQNEAFFQSSGKQ
jgi:parvulin-like peptidyl-prolyl isomerase